MELEVNATKTYDEYYAEHPDLYDNVDGYAWSEDEQKWINTGVTDVIKMLIADWFGDRVVCHDDKFGKFFRRKMNICALRYANLSRIELSAFDPLVADYVERQAIENSTRTTTNESNRENNNSNTSTRTPELTHTESASRTATDHRNNEATDITSHTGEHDNDATGMDKVAPQSISYANVTAGELPALDWQYATGQRQSKDKGNEKSNDNTTHNSTDEGGSSELDERTNKETGKEVTTGSGTSSDSESSSGNEIGNGERREISTGRGGLTPQEAFRSAVDYLKDSSAFEWLYDELSECFLCIYDI